MKDAALDEYCVSSLDFDPDELLQKLDSVGLPEGQGTEKVERLSHQVSARSQAKRRTGNRPGPRFVEINSLPAPPILP